MEPGLHAVFAWVGDSTMVVAVHALTGAALSRLCRTRTQAFLLGVASHVVEDLLPHKDLSAPVEGALVAGALGLIGALCGTDSREFAGAVGAALPDAENAVGRLLHLPEEKMLWPTHRGWHGRGLDSIASQAAIAAACLAVISRPRCATASQCGKPSMP